MNHHVARAYLMVLKRRARLEDRMRIVRSTPLWISRIALSAAFVAGITFATADVDAQSRGGRGGGGSGGKPSFSGGGHGGGQGGWHGVRQGGGNHGSWSGGGNRGGNHGSWSGGGHRGGSWSGGGHGRHWNGGHGNRWHGGHGYYRNGWYGGRYYYPGWALGLGVGIGLTYPWWGYPYAYTYPSSYVVYEGAYDAPVGVVVDRDVPIASPAPAPAPAYRWYCPAPAGFHPDVRECTAGWMKVLPNEGGPSSAPPSTVPRSSAPLDDEPPGSRIGPSNMGRLSAPVRIAAPSMTPPSQIARGYDVPRASLAQNSTQ